MCLQGNLHLVNAGAFLEQNCQHPYAFYLRVQCCKLWSGLIFHMRVPTKSPGGHWSFFAILKVLPATPLVQTWLWLRVFLAFCFASPMACRPPASPLLAHQWWDRRSVFLWNRTRLHHHSSLSAWEWWCQERQMCFAFRIPNSCGFAETLFFFSSQLWHSFHSYKGKFFWLPHSSF